MTGDRHGRPDDEAAERLLRGEPEEAQDQDSRALAELLAAARRPAGGSKSGEHAALAAFRLARSDARRKRWRVRSLPARTAIGVTLAGLAFGGIAVATSVVHFGAPAERRPEPSAGSQDTTKKGSGSAVPGSNGERSSPPGRSEAGKRELDRLCRAYWKDAKAPGKGLGGDSLDRLAAEAGGAGNVGGFCAERLDRASPEPTKSKKKDKDKNKNKNGQGQGNQGVQGGQGDQWDDEDDGGSGGDDDTGNGNGNGNRNNENGNNGNNGNGGGNGNGGNNGTGSTGNGTLNSGGYVNGGNNGTGNGHGGHEGTGSGGGNGDANGSRGGGGGAVTTPHPPALGGNPPPPGTARHKGRPCPATHPATRPAARPAPRPAARPARSAPPRRNPVSRQGPRRTSGSEPFRLLTEPLGRTL